MSVSVAAARVYAKALFDIGLAAGDVGAAGEDLHAVRDALGGLEEDLAAFFALPQLHREDKRHIINLAFGDKVGRPVLGLLNVLVEKRREALLDTVVAEFDALADRHSGRLQASVVTARKLDADLVEALRTALERRTRKTVVLHQRVDPGVIGGLRVNLADEVLDGTIRRGLADMRRDLASSQT